MAKSGQGLVLVITGEGKGKTTSAFGLALRAVGQGQKVFLIQFIKGTWKTGEVEAAKRLAPELEVCAGLGDGFTWITKNPDQDRLTSREIWKIAREAIESKKYDLVILDEINLALRYGHLEAAEMIEVLERRDPALHVMPTGGGAPQEIIDCADLASDVRKIKHPFDRGVKAQPGVEF